jgi:hypothetical protein
MRKVAVLDHLLPLTRSHLCVGMTKAKSNAFIATNLDTSLWTAERRSTMKKRKKRRKKKRSRSRQRCQVAAHYSLSMRMYM